MIIYKTYFLPCKSANFLALMLSLEGNVLKLGKKIFLLLKISENNVTSIYLPPTMSKC